MDRQQFTERARKLEARLYRIGYGLLREEQDRMDAVQEALLKAWRHCGRLKDDAYFDQRMYKHPAPSGSTARAG